MMIDEATILGEMPRLRAFLARRLGDRAADDALQETMLATLAGRARLRDGAQQRALLVALLWRAGALTTDLKVRPLREWER